MLSVKAGKIGEFIFFIIATVITVYFLWSAISRKKKFPLRTLPAIEAISDGVDKAIEEGKPVFFSLGAYATLSQLFAPQTVAGLNVMRYVTKLCVRKGAEIYYPVPMNPETQPIIDGIYREGCVSEGKPEMYHRDHVFFSGSQENNYAVGLSSMISRLSPSCYVVVGALTGTGDTNAAATANVNGAVVVGGTGRYGLLGTYALLCHYPLFLDDIFAASAFCSADPEVMSTLWGEDVVKIGMFVLLFAAVLLTLAGINIGGKGGWLVL